MAANNRWRPANTYNDFHKIFGDNKFIPVVEKPTEYIQGGFYVVFADTETTGLDSEQNQIVQFSGIKYLFANGKLFYMDELDMFIRNWQPVPPEVSKVNHITEELLANAPEEKEAFEKIEKFLGNSVFVAYNTPFDLGFIKALYQRQGRWYNPRATFDVMAMFIDLYSVYKCQQRKLSAAAKFLGLVNGDESFHNSLDDIRMTVKVFATLAEKYAELPKPADTSACKTPRIYKHWFWENPQRYAMKRIYFSTDCGKIFFEKLDRSFGTDGAYKLTDLNMEGFLKSACGYLRVGSIEEMSHIQFPKPTEST